MNLEKDPELTSRIIEAIKAKIHGKEEEKK